MQLNKYLREQEYGSAVKLAKEVGVSPVQVHMWRKGKRTVPVARAAAIEKATNGAVTRRDLRPDDWQDHWPELASATEGAAA